MGDRFYEAQKKGSPTKPKRKLKKDYIAEVDKLLGADIVGLDKCTIPTLTQLIEAINAKSFYIH